MKKVLIEWVDSKGITNEWEYKDDIEPLKPTKCSTLGFLLEDTKEYKTIACTVSEDQIIGRLTIPSKAITKMKNIRA